MNAKGIWLVEKLWPQMEPWEPKEGKWEIEGECYLNTKKEAERCASYERSIYPKVKIRVSKYVRLADVKNLESL